MHAVVADVICKPQTREPDWYFSTGHIASTAPAPVLKLARHEKASLTTFIVV